MDDYISREELRKHLKECYDDELFDPDMKKAVFGIDMYIENMPAADVQPVRHGRWCGYLCSECNEYADYFLSGDEFYFDEKPNFCPNCGARMDGDSKC